MSDDSSMALNVLYVGSVEERSLLRMLAMAATQGLPPAEVVEQLSGEFTGAFSIKLRHLSGLLASGVTVVDALDQVPGVLDTATVMALRLAEAENELPKMYRQLLAIQPDSMQTVKFDNESPEYDAWRSIVSLFALALMLAFMMTYIVPTYEKMFVEFGLDLPQLTLALFLFASYVPVLVLMLAGVMMVYFLFHSGRYFQFIVNRCKSVRWQRRMVPSHASLLALLAVAVQSPRSLASGIATLASAHPKNSVRKRLSQVCQQIEMGADPIAALAGTGVITSRESASLALTQSANARSWLLGWFAHQRWDRYNRRTPLFFKSMKLICMVLFAVITAWTVISLFMPIVSLIAGLT